MRQRVDLQFLEEASQFRLRATCDTCVHFAEISGTCAEGYPNHDHLRRPLRVGDELVFCKEYELC